MSNLTWATGFLSVLRFWLWIMNYLGSTCSSDLMLSRTWGVCVTSNEILSFPQLDQPLVHSHYHQQAWLSCGVWSEQEDLGCVLEVVLWLSVSYTKNKLAGYLAPKQLSEEYNHKLRLWIDNGWLLLYPEDELGPLKSLIPLIVVLQVNKQKVRPVMDSMNTWMLNEQTMSSMNTWTHTQQGLSVALLDFCWAYQQIHVNKSLWSFQMVKIKEQRYCLIRLGFELNMAPQIMYSIVKAMIRQDDVINCTTSSHIDDIFNENTCCAAHVKAHLKRFGLTSKDWTTEEWHLCVRFACLGKA